MILPIACVDDHALISHNQETSCLILPKLATAWVLLRFKRTAYLQVAYLNWYVYLPRAIIIKPYCARHIGSSLVWITIVSSNQYQLEQLDIIHFYLSLGFRMKTSDEFIQKIYTLLNKLQWYISISIKLCAECQSLCYIPKAKHQLHYLIPNARAMLGMEGKVIIFIQHSHSMYNCLPLYYLIEKLSCIGAHVSRDCFKFNKSTHDARAMLGMERKSTLVTTLEYDSIQNCA